MGCRHFEKWNQYNREKVCVFWSAPRSDFRYGNGTSTGSRRRGMARRGLTNCLNVELSDFGATGQHEVLLQSSDPSH
jgi:hypothetical protein